MKRRILSIISLILIGILPGAGGGSGAIPQDLPILNVDQGILSMVYPIAIPVGTRESQPPLALVYRSLGRNGPAGIGWELTGVPEIRRDSSTAVNYDGTDDYSSRHGSLTLINPGQRIFHSKRESFSRFVASGSCGDAPCEWIETDRTGNKYYYGASPDSQIEADGHSGSIRAWALARTEDPYGNGFNVSYYRPTTGSYYPETITYNNRRIEFEYEDRPDKRTDYSQSAPVEFYHRLSKIHVKINGSTIRTYSLLYDQNQNGLSRLVKIKRSGSNPNGSELYDDLDFSYSNPSPFSVNTLSSGSVPLEYQVRVPVLSNGPVKGACKAYETNCACTALGLCIPNPVTGIPTFPMCCPWMSTAQQQCTEYITHKSWLLPPYSQDSHQKVCGSGALLNTKAWMAGDVNGDGRTDFIRLSGSEGNVRPVINFISESGIGGDTPAPFSLPVRFDSFFSVADINGDGRSDFVYETGGVLHVAFSNGSNFSGPSAMGNVAVPPTDAPRFDENKSGVQPRSWLADMDGDGRQDFVRLDGSTIGISLSQGTSFVNLAGQGVSSPNGEDQNFGDIDGDGRPEYLRIIGDQLVATYFNASLSGNSTRAFSLGGAADSKNRWFVDVNGDGKADFLRIINNKLATSLFTGDSFTKVEEISISGGAVNNSRVADVNGDGFTDFVYQESSQVRVIYSTGRGFAGAQTAVYNGGAYFITDVNADQKADFVRIENGLSNIMVDIQPIEHDSLLTSVSASSERKVDIKYNLPMHLPGAVNWNSSFSYPDVPNTSSIHVVTDVRTQRGYRREIGGFVPELETNIFDYQDYRFFRGTRDDRAITGFKTIRVTNQETAESVLTRYSQAPPFHSQPIEISHFNSTGNLMARENLTHENRNPFTGTDVVHKKSEVSASYLDGVFVASRERRFDYDNYGNVTKMTAIGSETIITEATYDYDFSNWLLDRSATVKRSSGGTTFEDVHLTHNGPSLTRIDSKVLPGGQTATYSFGYDGYGNITSSQTPGGNTTTLTYDANVNFFQTSSTDGLGNRVQKEYDLLGNVTRTTDPNGVTEETNYDGFGRVIRQKNPGETGPFSIEVIYANTGDSRQQYTETRIRDDSVTDGVQWSREYKDDLDRTYLKESEGYLDLSGGVQHVIVETFDFDNRGRMVRTAGPHLPGIAPAQYKAFEYNHPDGLLSRIVEPDGDSNSFTYNGLSVTHTDGAGRSSQITRNVNGRILERTDPAGKKTNYEYSAIGKLTKVVDPEGRVTAMEYNNLGLMTRLSDPASGVSTYDYNSAGYQTARTDARGKKIQYEYDLVGRVTRVDRPDGEFDTEYRYDELTVNNGRGRLTRAIDETGETRFSYDGAGNIASLLRSVDGIPFNYHSVYDTLGRKISITYPDGSVVRRIYSTSGHLQTVTLDGYPIVSYAGPLAGGKFRRETGNGVKTEIDFNLANHRPLKISTILKNGESAQDLTYGYDLSGNIQSITDGVNPGNSQTFEYDILNRLTKTTKSTDSTEYAYTAGGNLLKKGNIALAYNDAQHPGAVTEAQLPPGPVQYAYDAAGNMIRRKGDHYRYDSQSRLSKVLGADLSLHHAFTYDYSGARIKKHRTNDDTIIYSSNGMYEVRRTPGEPEHHTIYIRGFRDEIVAQYTRTNINLIGSKNAREQEGKLIAWNENALTNTLANFWHTSANGTLPPGLLWLELRSSPVMQRQLILSLFVLLLFLLIGIPFLTQSKAERIGRLREKPLFGILVPLLIGLLLITQQACVALPSLTSTPEGDPPWHLALGGIGSGTPGIQDNPQTDPTTTPINPGAHGMPVNGMYYFHSDHLGSIRLISDAKGQHVSGVDIATGKSNIEYNSYGEIDRTNSDGPDIFRYKYTQQEEDADTGLFYYKSRFYDPEIGRFIQPDEFSFPGDVQGMNKYMYVEGNPIKFNDPMGYAPILPTLPRKSNNPNWPLLWPRCYPGNGNCDPYAGRHNQINNIYGVERDNLGVTDYYKHPELYFMRPPKPTSYVDQLGLAHDREMPAGNFFGCYEGDKNNYVCRVKAFKANARFIKNWFSLKHFTTNFSMIAKRNENLGSIRYPLALIGAANVGGWEMGMSWAVGVIFFSIDNIHLYLTDPMVRNGPNKTDFFLRSRLSQFSDTSAGIGDATNILFHIELLKGNSGKEQIEQGIQRVVDELDEIKRDYFIYEYSKACDRVAGFKCW